MWHAIDFMVFALFREDYIDPDQQWKSALTTDYMSKGLAAAALHEQRLRY